MVWLDFATPGHTTHTSHGGTGHVQYSTQYYEHKNILTLTSDATNRLSQHLVIDMFIVFGCFDLVENFDFDSD